jgi:hypothetical protein
MESTDQPSWVYQQTGILFDEGTTWEEWEKLWNNVQQIHRSVLWFCGDALKFADRKWPDKWPQAVDGYATETMNVAKWVAERIELERRRPNVSYTIHRTVASLEPADQDKLLDRAEREKWRTGDAALAVKAVKAGRYNGTRDDISPLGGHVVGASDLFGPSGRTKEPEPPPGFTPRVVAGKDVEPGPDQPYAFLWAVVEAARDAIAKDEITHELRKAVHHIDALEAIVKRTEYEAGAAQIRKHGTINF